MANDQAVIATAGLVSVGVGTANSILKYKKPPSTRFLIGSGVAFLLLSAMANSDALAEVAKGLALGVMSTILLGEGGGVLSWFAGEEETNTSKPAARKSSGTQTTRSQRDAVQSPSRTTVVIRPNGAYLPDRAFMPNGKSLPAN